jgi:hypothetical protein
MATADGDAQLSVQIMRAYTQVAAYYGTLSIGDWFLVRQTLLAFFQDKHTTVR